MQNRGNAKHSVISYRGSDDCDGGGVCVYVWRRGGGKGLTCFKLEQPHHSFCSNSDTYKSFSVCMNDLYSSL